MGGNVEVLAQKGGGFKGISLQRRGKGVAGSLKIMLTLPCE